MSGEMSTVICFKYPNRVEYYRDVRRHREDGPAIERANGTREWWFEGTRLSGPEELARVVGGERE